jgi:hypothetical protein
MTKALPVAAFADSIRRAHRIPELGYAVVSSPEFAVGWFWHRDAQGRQVSFHRGNPGTFLTKVYICKDADKAYIFFANVQSAAAETGMTLLYEALSRTYGR